MHSGLVPAKIRTTLGAEMNPVRTALIGSVCLRSTPVGDKYKSSCIADTRKGTAEVIRLAELIATLVFRYAPL